MTPGLVHVSRGPHTYAVRKEVICRRPPWNIYNPWPPVSIVGAPTVCPYMAPTTWDLHIETRDGPFEGTLEWAGEEYGYCVWYTLDLYDLTWILYLEDGYAWRLTYSGAMMGPNFGDTPEGDYLGPDPLYISVAHVSPSP